MRVYEGFVSILAVFFLFPSLAFAHETGVAHVEDPFVGVSAGVTPDNFFYGLDVAIDQLSLLLSFDSGDKARKNLEIARERLLEARKMALENKIEAMQRAEEEHRNALNSATSSLRALDRANSTEELEEEIEIEREIEQHKTKIEEIRGELKIKIKVEGVITSEQQALIDSTLASLEGKTGEVEIEIENEEGKTKIEIEAETGKSSEEVEELEDDIEEAEGLTEVRKGKVLDKILDVEEDFLDLKKELAKVNITDGNLTSIENLLTQAKSAYNATNFVQAINLSKQAEDLIESLEESFEVEEKELEIEVEIEEGVAKIEVEFDGEDLEFTLDTTDRTQIVSAIAEKTGLTVAQIESVMKLEIEEEEESLEEELEEIETETEEKDKETEEKSQEED